MNTDITILFGSQTGNSEDVAHRIAREAKKRHKSVYISTLDDYDVVSFSRLYLVLSICYIRE